MSASVASPPEVARRLDDSLHEVVNGERVELPSTSIFSTLIANRLFLCLAAHLGEHPIGLAVIGAPLILDREANVRRRPDVAFVSAARWPLDREFPETGDWDVIPTIAIEVIGPNDKSLDVLEKMLEYFHYGVEEVWNVHPEAKTVYRYESPFEAKIFGPDNQLVSTRLPGFACPLVDLFRRTAGDRAEAVSQDVILRSIRNARECQK